MDNQSALLMKIIDDIGNNADKYNKNDLHGEIVKFYTAILDLRVVEDKSLLDRLTAFTLADLQGIIEKLDLKIKPTKRSKRYIARLIVSAAVLEEKSDRLVTLLESLDSGVGRKANSVSKSKRKVVLDRKSPKPIDTESIKNNIYKLRDADKISEYLNGFRFKDLREFGRLYNIKARSKKELVDRITDYFVSNLSFHILGRTEKEV